jgi:tetratricopeptide (TPR) repeat protein
MPSIAVENRFRHRRGVVVFVAGWLIAGLLTLATPLLAQTETEWWRNAVESGRSALASGNLTVAQNYAQQAIDQAMTLSGTPSTSLPLAESYELMAQVEAKFGNLDRAQDMMNQALAILRAALPPDHPDLGRAVLRYADLQRAEGNYAQADRLYRDSIVAITSSLGPGNILLADAYYGLALNELAQGKTESADHMLAQAMSVLGLQGGIPDRDNLFDLRPFAEAYREMGLIDDETRVLRQAMDFYARHYAVDHPFYEDSMMMLGEDQLKRGLADDARGTFDRGTEQMLLALGPGSERVAMTMENIAALFERYDRPADAEAYLKKALDVRQRSIGTVGADKVRSLVKIGDLARERGDNAQAESYYREAAQYGETRLTPNNVETAYAYSNLALVLWNRGAVDEAARLWTRALSIYEQRLGPDDLDVATVAFNLGQLRHRQGQYPEAEALYRRALDIRERVLGPDDPRTRETAKMYALLLDRLGRSDEAARIRARAN